MTSHRVEVPFGAQTLILETGKLAKQANASVLATLGGTSVLVAICMSKQPKTGVDFFPLMVEYQEKIYAAGRIPGGFFKREGRPTQKEILTSRVIDRPIRPLFPKGFHYDVVVTCTVMSSDGVNDPDMVALVAASAALHISDIPFAGPIGAVRVAKVDGQFIANPTYEQREQSILDFIVVGLEKGIVMIEGEADDIPEDDVVAALEFGFNELQAVRLKQEEFRQLCGKEKSDVELYVPHPDLKTKVEELCSKNLDDAYKIADKLERETALQTILNDILSDMSSFESLNQDGQEVTEADIRSILDYIEYEHVRDNIFNKDLRADGRKCQELREITSEINILPRTHGSSLFTRGQTQSLAIVTLGTKRDEQMIESLTGMSYNNFMLHYNFPAFSVGEARGSRGPGRREIGHGALASKAIKSVLPSKEEFPYTVRVVSEILESNGSSSMASVCAGCLSLMAAGVPIKAPVAGISVGLVTNGDDFRLLTDIMGLEDHFGDMDYKIAGTTNGVTAIQLDLKITGVPMKVLAEGIFQAREARLKILNNMTAVIPQAKESVSEFAPRIVSSSIPVEKIGEFIGPGGKNIKKIMEETGTDSIDIEEDGKVMISGMTSEAVDKALHYIEKFVEVPKIGKIYDSKVVKVTNFGAFVEILPGRQGLVHVSELADEFIKDVSSVVKVGDEFKVLLVEIDQMKRMNLSKIKADKALAK